MQAFVDVQHPRHRNYDSLTTAFRSIVREDGYGAFFRGLTPRAARIICAPPAVALLTRHTLRLTPAPSGAIFILSYCRSELTPVYERNIKGA